MERNGNGRSVMNVYDMNREQFHAALAEKTTPQKLLNNAKDIYEYMTTLFDQQCGDSVLREWAFQWVSEQLGIDYDVVYSRWLNSDGENHYNASN